MFSFVHELGLWRPFNFRGARCFWVFLHACVLGTVFLFFFSRWSADLWEERANAAGNLFRKPAKTEETTLWQRLTKTTDILSCSPRTACSPLSYSYNISDYNPSNEACPFYFKWIKQDLKPWEKPGITLETVESGKRLANFRVIIIDGRLFVESYIKAFQTRDLFTIWGFAQLLKFYPGMVPDVDLMFHAGDKPIVMRKKFDGPGVVPPPIFRYCGTQDSFDIPFPDWSFWGWPEVGIPPWEVLTKDLSNANEKLKWDEREPFAFWRGNPNVSKKRRDLLECSKKPGWKGRVFSQNWLEEQKHGYKDSKLVDQCKHRYKLYVEGNAWSVSLKYIMACDSTTLLVDTPFIDFYIRGLLPDHDYWPIRPRGMCGDVDFAVDWGNNNTQKAKEIGKLGTDYVIQNVSMTQVYSYMLHSLNEYAKLLRYKPKVTEKASEFCQETIPCFVNDKEKKYMRASMASAPNSSPPCQLSQNVTEDEADIADFGKRKIEAVKHILSLKL